MPGYQRTPTNLRQEGSLDVVLDAIEYPIYGIHQYPTRIEKAAILGWTIMHGHVFFDGNKRTGIYAVETFLLLNGYRMDYSTEEIVNTAVSVADNNDPFSIDDLESWLTNHINRII